MVRMDCISSCVAGRATPPITFWRMVLCPVKVAQLVPMPCSSIFWKNSLAGSIPLPHIPVITVVTPILRYGSLAPLRRVLS